MDSIEKKVLLFIRFIPILIIIIIYIAISLFLYINNCELFTKYFKEIAFLSITFILISLYFSYQITNFLRKSFIKYQNKILNELEENKEKDFILFQQSKLATIGELLCNISHQWRQPLSIITTTASGIKIQKQFGIDGRLNEMEMLESILNNANYLSQTIEDFRDFYTPITLKTDFLISKCISKCIKIVNPQFSDKNISIKQEVEDFNINGFEQQLIQVLINLLNNSRDKFEESNKNNNIIFIKTSILKDIFLITIIDNAGGIDKLNFINMFKPYFTTKDKSKGIGISLYMSHQIILKSFDGNITAENIEIKHLGKTYIGAKFKIIIPSNS